MKQMILSCTSILLCFSSLQAQQIKYEPSFATAQRTARQQEKPLAILITIQPPVPTPNFLKGLSDEAVVDKFNNSFVNYKVAKEDTAKSGPIIREFKVSSFPSFIFLDAKGGLLSKDIAIANSPKPLLALADKALNSTSQKSLVDFDAEFQSGNHNPAFLKEYITRRKEAGIPDNAELIEVYVSGLTVADLNKYHEVFFILQAGPFVDSNAYKLATSNKKIIDSIFKNEPLPLRIAMNNESIQNTLNKAISEKNISRAIAAAQFARKTYGSNYQEAQKNSQARMLQYYFGVHDTLQYLQNAAIFYDTYYMKISLDSVRKKDSLMYEYAKKNAKEIEVVKVNDNIFRRTVSIGFPKDTYATGLNNAAWNFYKLASGRDEFLLKAMLWSKRAIEHSPKAAYHDTYAHLLYKLKLFSEAESMQLKAIEIANSDKIDSSGYQKEYEKMKKRTL